MSRTQAQIKKGPAGNHRGVMCGLTPGGVGQRTQRPNIQGHILRPKWRRRWLAKIVQILGANQTAEVLRRIDRSNWSHGEVAINFRRAVTSPERTLTKPKAQSRWR